MGLKGRVKSIKESCYKAIEKNGEYIKQEKAGFQYNPNESFISFNIKGFITEKIESGISTDYYCRITNSYNMNDNIVEYCRYDRLQNCDYKKVTTYNNLNNVIAEEIYESDNKLKNKTECKYDKNGFGVESIEYLANGDLHEKTIVKNDYKGNPIEVSVYDSQGKLKKNETCKYDNNNNLIESKSSWDSRKQKYKYDEKNNRIETKFYQGDRGLINKVSTIYGKDGKKIIEKSVYEKDYHGNESYTTTKYDIKGNEIVKYSKNIRGDKTTILKQTNKIKYDGNGYKVESKKYFDDKLSSIEKWAYNDNGKVYKDYLWCHGGEVLYKDDLEIANQYQYDSKDNLISTTTINSWYGTFIIEKEIEYY